MIAVDTNVLVRFLVRDDRKQAARAAALLRSSSVWISKNVLLETEWVLRSLYGFSPEVTDVFMTAQSVSAIGMVQHLVPDRSNVVRISPVVAKDRFDLDDVKEIPSLKGLGDSEARKALPSLRPMFFETPAQNDFTPFYWPVSDTCADGEQNAEPERLSPPGGALAS